MMKRKHSPVYPALILILGCVIFRLLSSKYPEFIPNISPLMAIAYVGAMYLPRRWGWLIGPVALLITDLAFVRMNYLAEGSMFSWWTLIAFGVYAAAGGLGMLISRRKTLTRIAGGSLGCSLVFYVASNTFSWANNVVLHQVPGYPSTLAGWWQANTAGLAGYPPTWLFLRNGMAGDLFFGLLLLLALDRGLLFGRASAGKSPAKAAARMA